MTADDNKNRKNFNRLMEISTSNDIHDPANPHECAVGCIVAQPNTFVTIFAPNLSSADQHPAGRLRILSSLRSLLTRDEFRATSPASVRKCHCNALPIITLPVSSKHRYVCHDNVKLTVTAAFDRRTRLDSTGRSAAFGAVGAHAGPWKGRS